MSIRSNTPFPHLLTSNGYPSEPEELAIRNLILNAEREISRLQTLCNTLASDPFPEKGLHLKQLRMKLLSASVDMHKGMVSPVRRLPAELLGQFFTYAASHPDLDITKGSPLYNIRQPYHLSQVSRLWRTVAISLPQLWTNIPHLRYRFPHKYQQQIANHIEITRIHLERSRSAPINISMQLDVRLYTEPPVEKSYPALALLVSHCDRWLSLSVSFNTSSLEYLSAKVRHRLPLLTSLKISMDGDPRGEDCDLFMDAPTLRQLVLPPASTLDVNRLKFPWQSLRHFSGYHRDFLIAKPRSLLTCHLHGDIVYPIDGGNSVYSEVPGIRYLRLDFTGENIEPTGQPIRPTISFPYLESLDVKISTSHMIWLCRTTGYTFQYLTALRLHLDDGDIPIFREFLKFVPKLSSLDITGALVEELACLSSQDADSGNPRWLPLLTSLTIRGVLGRKDKVPSVLNNIVGLRYKPHPDSMVGENLSTAKAVPVFNLKYVFDNDTDCIDAFIGVEEVLVLYKPELEYGPYGSQPNPRADEFNRMRSQRDYLRRRFFGIKSGAPPNSTDFTAHLVHFIDTRHQDMSQPNETFEAIEKDEKIDVVNLEMSRLPILMRDLSLVGPGLLPQDYIYNFQSRAAALVERWAPMVEGSQKGRKWFIDDFSVTLNFPVL